MRPTVQSGHPVVQMRDVWTLADLQSLDVEDWRQYEIVDGALVVSPTPGVKHEVVIDNLRSLVLAQAPDGLGSMGNIGVRLGRSYRIADLTLAHRPLIDMDADSLEPHEVVLVVEVVSPGSMSMDRVLKPAQYAAAGIAHFWRVETDPIGLSAFALPAGGDTYLEVGTWTAGETARIEAPFPVEVEIDRLLAG